MKIAWFAGTRLPFDDTPSLQAELGRRHHVDTYDPRRAHDFVWQHVRDPFDLCVYELRDRADDAFIWPYLLQYPGLLRLRSAQLGRSRRESLRLRQRTSDDAAEAAFAGRDRLRIPLLASRLVVVGDDGVAAALQERYPDARIRSIAPAVDIDDPHTAPAGSPGGAPLHVGIRALSPVIDGAVRRARAAGVTLDLHIIDSPAALAACDAIVALDWPPPPEPPLPALWAMAAGRTAIVFEGPATAAWPALDPQTWRTRGFGDARPAVAISLDARDAEHSLLLALVRLARDAGLPRALGSAALAWARDTGGIARTARRWHAVLEEAASLSPPERPGGWPAHLNADGTERARALVDEVGASFPL